MPLRRRSEHEHARMAHPPKAAEGSDRDRLQGPPQQVQPFQGRRPGPGTGEVTIERARGRMNPADYKGSPASGCDRVALPLPLGSEVAGVITALGPDTESPPAAARRRRGARLPGSRRHASPSRCRQDVFAKPARLTSRRPRTCCSPARPRPTAARRRPVGPARPSSCTARPERSASACSSRRGARRPRLGTASERTSTSVRRSAGSVAYGDGLRSGSRPRAGRRRGRARHVGTDGAVDVVARAHGRGRMVTIAAAGRGEREGFRPRRQHPRERRLPGRGPPRLSSSPRAGAGRAGGGTCPLHDAAKALEQVQGQRPSGKLALIP